MSRVISHEEYLRRMLESKKYELENAIIEQRIAIVEYDTKMKMIREQINSIEKQLDDHKNPIL